MMDTKPQELLWKEKKVCRVTSLGRTTLWRLRRSGKLPAVYIGRSVRYRPEDVMRLVEHGETDIYG